MMMTVQLAPNAFSDRLMFATTEYRSASWTDEL